MSAFVYVLKSQRNGRYYNGSTTDHSILRYHQHASGRVASTVGMLPVTVEGWKQFEDLTAARRAEYALKQKKSRVGASHGG